MHFAGVRSYLMPRCVGNLHVRYQKPLRARGKNGLPHTSMPFPGYLHLMQVNTTQVVELVALVFVSDGYKMSCRI